jgi:phage-related protein
MDWISVASALHKREIASTAPWHVFLTVYPDYVNAPDVVLRLAREPDDVVYQGNTYIAFSFDFDAIWDKSSGELQALRLTVCNVNRLVQGYLEQYGGGVGAQVEIRVVSAKDITSPPAQLFIFEVTNTMADAQWATFTLGAANPMLRAFPKFLYFRNYCNWLFNTPDMQNACDPRGAPCGYYGALATCQRTLEDCRVHSNSARFGGFPAIDTQGFRAVGPV